MEDTLFLSLFFLDWKHSNCCKCISTSLCSGHNVCGWRAWHEASTPTHRIRQQKEKTKKTPNLWVIQAVVSQILSICEVYSHHKEKEERQRERERERERKREREREGGTVPTTAPIVTKKWESTQNVVACWKLQLPTGSCPQICLKHFRFPEISKFTQKSQTMPNHTIPNYQIWQQKREKNAKSPATRETSEKLTSTYVLQLSCALQVIQRSNKTSKSTVKWKKIDSSTSRFK